MKKHVLMLLSVFILLGLCPIELYAGWTRSYGGGGIETGTYVEQTSDGGYIVVGTTDSWGAGLQDIWLLKLDSEGDTLWMKTLGGAQGEGNCLVREVSDSAYIITAQTYSFGSTDSDIWLIKTDLWGDTIWTDVYVREGNERPVYLEKDYSGMYVIIAYKEYNSQYYIWCGITDKDGAGHTEDDFDEYVQCSNVGYYRDFIAVGNGELYWFDDSGVIKWVNYPSWEVYYIAPDYNGYVMTGMNYPDELTLTIWLSKADPEGNEIWTKYYGESGTGYCVQPTPDSGYIVTTSNWTLLRTDRNGDSLWTRNYPGDYRYLDVTSDGGYVLVGSMNGNLCLVKTGPDGDTLGIIEEPEPLLVTPVTHLEIASPIGREVVVRYSEHPYGFHALVYDVTGRIVDELHSIQTQGTITWGEGHTSGVYFIRSLAGSSLVIKKVVLLE